jgi:hypothetical protein
MRQIGASHDTQCICTAPCYSSILPWLLTVADTSLNASTFARFEQFHSYRCCIERIAVLDVHSELGVYDPIHTPTRYSTSPPPPSGSALAAPGTVFEVPNPEYAAWVAANTPLAPSAPVVETLDDKKQKIKMVEKELKSLKKKVSEDEGLVKARDMAKSLGCSCMF